MENKNLKNIKSTGFNTPKDYFESFDESLMHTLKTKRAFNSIEKPGFKIPDGYFKSLDDKIFEAISDEKGSKVIPLFSKRNLVYVSSIAAAILLLFNLSIFDKTPSFDDLETETVENYIIDENISSYEMAALFIDENETINIELNLNDDNLEEYLLNDADIELLMIE